ncbi:hypothetical protein HK104_011385 [Borealophlyctis nickersoniae]|nr:hypothetical protein HK104_011385 [Borealophlyctis nickersoniae]
MSKLYTIPSSSVVVDRTSKPLGRGGFGIVRKGTWGGAQVAVKILSDQALTERELNDFRLEARTNHAIPRHANILAFFGIIDEPGHYALVMELMPKGSLFDLIAKGESLAWDERRRIARDIACGMFYLHEANVLHCDLKSLNICIELNVTSVIFVDHLCQKIITEPLYTKECDVFSYGITLTELFTMAGPYGVNYKELDVDILVDLVKSGKRQELPSDIPADLLDLVQECWAHDPQQRPPISRIAERFDISGSAPVYHSARDELYFTPPAHPPQSFRNNDQNTAYLTPVTALGSGQSAHSTPSSPSPVSQASSGQSIDGENRDGDSAASDVAASDVASLMQRSGLSPATQCPTPTAAPLPKSASASSSGSAAVIVNPTDLEKLYEKGRALDQGLGDEESRNHSAAFECFHKAAIAGHPASQAVGVVGVEKNEAKAVEWYQKAADQGNQIGQFNLGHCYEHGIGVAKDERRAVEWYEKAAKQGHDVGQYNLGFCYQNGRGVAKDETRAVEWYEKAAKQGHALGQYNLGRCYHYGKTKRGRWSGTKKQRNRDNGFGVGKDETRAVEWYEKAAKQGHALGQYNLGTCYHYGTGVAKNETRAVEWYRKAAAQGNTKAIEVLEVVRRGQGCNVQ